MATKAAPTIIAAANPIDGVNVRPVITISKVVDASGVR
jgi:hypothetical protein